MSSRTLIIWTLAATALMAGFSACIAIGEGQGLPKPIPDADAGALDAFIVQEAAATDARSELPPSDPHAVVDVTPPHGSFSGSIHAIVRGAGFTSSARVWFGPAQVSPSDTTVIDPGRIQVQVPPGLPGYVEVSVQNGDDASTRRTLADGFHYDSFEVTPHTGSTVGGTLVHLFGKQTNWTAGVAVTVGGEACDQVSVVSAEELTCVTPAHAEGSVSVAVQQGSSKVLVSDAFIYMNSQDGYQGGLSGGPLGGHMTVAAYDMYTGNPIPGVHAIVGADLNGALHKKTNAVGQVSFDDPSLTGKVTVTVAKHCFQPTTFVDVPVDHVAAYMMPVLSPTCGADAGDVPPVGGHGYTPGYVSGELVWEGNNEFKRSPWINVPAPKTETEVRAAYVFTPSYSPTRPFYLPSSSEAVHPDADGSRGYRFQISARGGNLTLYALAGIEDRSKSPAMFTPYAFGMVRGVTAQPGHTTPNVFIPMTTPLDQTVTLQVKPPSPGPRGPDRLVSGVAVSLGADGYALFPQARRSTSISSSAQVNFVGLPGLTGPLLGANFVSFASAVTGASEGSPLSIVRRYVTHDASQVVTVSGFVQVPVLTSPNGATGFDGRHLTLNYAPGGANVDVTVVRIDSSSGLIEWLVVAPGNPSKLTLPDIESLDAGLIRGDITVRVSAASIDDPTFSYQQFRYRSSRASGWSAYAEDEFHVNY